MNQKRHYIAMFSLFAAAVFLNPAAAHAQKADALPAATSSPALTIYNQNFAVVRETVPLNLQAGQNRVTFNRITSRLEPDSVILRDPAGKRDLRILEQNYEADPLSQAALLKHYEGQTIEFVVPQTGGSERIVSGKIVRSGNPNTGVSYNYGYNPNYPNGGQGQPIVEIDGKLRFGLPGTPIFPRLTGGETLKPTLTWNLFADKAGAFDAELAYVTDDMSWESAYNIVMPPQGDNLSLTGWVTMTNRSGIDFANVHVKLMAGTPSKIVPGQSRQMYGARSLRVVTRELGASPAVTEQSFDEYHLYTLPLPTTLKNGETKQVEFVHGEGIKSQHIYIYDGAKLGDGDFDYNNIRNQREYGVAMNTHIWAMREFVNSKENHLGIPLPKGKVRFYRQGDGGALEFVGENVIDHTPQGETVRVFTGDAFDLVGERKQTNYSYKYGDRFADESFEIRVRNRKKEPATVRIVEHLYRGTTWTVVTPSVPFTKRDSHTVEFPVTIAPDGEQIVTYTAHYTW